MIAPARMKAPDLIAFARQELADYRADPDAHTQPYAHYATHLAAALDGILGHLDRQQGRVRFAALRQYGDVLLGRIRVPVACNSCPILRPWITQAEAELLPVHGHLLCPCGGQLHQAVIATGVHRG